jgi:hypothetical protein
MAINQKHIYDIFPDTRREFNALIEEHARLTRSLGIAKCGAERRYVREGLIEVGKRLFAIRRRMVDELDGAAA